MMEVNEEIRKHQDQLREIDQKLDEMYDISKETSKLITYFKKSVSTD